ncbi:hypothetical protein [Bacillus sp. Brlt_9]|uniref:hypothetical protein n=1 Tax=Bacillus sp. Brlt_9 TaxID=3110916 RepID=UPI003F7B9D39
MNRRMINKVKKIRTFSIIILVLFVLIIITCMGLLYYPINESEFKNNDKHNKIEVKENTNIEKEYVLGFYESSNVTKIYEIKSKIKKMIKGNPKYSIEPKFFEINSPYIYFKSTENLEDIKNTFKEFGYIDESGRDVTLFE